VAATRIAARPLAAGPANAPTAPPAPGDGGAHGRASGPAGGFAAAQVPILMYHYISMPPPGDRVRYNLSVTPDAFETQMTYLAVNGYHPVTLRQVADHLLDGAALPDRPIVLTFDDGYADNYVHALPVLRRRGYAATFFVITGFVDAGRPEYMTWRQLADLASWGMEVGAHSVDHPDLRGRSLRLQFAEVAAPKVAIEARLGVPVTSFAYPSGRFDATTVDVLRAAGYRAAVTTAPGTWQFAGGPYQLARVRVPGGGTIREFHAALTRAMAAATTGEAPTDAGP
jgi:peptidoglycan/xylan/chitin deacetylase (PgdA/CDA1 family)